MNEHGNYDTLSRIEHKIDLCLRFLQLILKEEQIMASDIKPRMESFVN